MPSSVSQPKSTQGSEAKLRVYASGVIAAPLMAVWDYVRDFNGLPKWFPGVADSSIEDESPSDRLRCVR
jgi:uncharacterized membrane protein